MVTFRSLSDCTWRDAVDIWNRGFEGYAIDMTTDEKKLTAHLAKNDLSPEYSIVAFYKGEPAGIILNGIRRIEGKKVAWNGGTGVAKPFRGRGIGKGMIEKCLEIYRKHGVEVATLEALETNQPAIALYKKMGYEVKDTLHFYSLDQTHPDHYTEGKFPYRVQRGMSREIMRLPFWRKWTPWQTQLANVPEAESVIVENEQGEAVGYALFKENTDETGMRTGTVLLQCETSSGAEDQKKVIQCLLSRVFRFNEYGNQSPEKYSCSTFNLTTNKDLLQILKEWGFQKKMGQVWMECPIRQT
ncbi:GNAT family N-acetyltransferase [Paenactinomyces guangxiensis]|uniref:GNAT family N-acetyltransferase n=1 Tax=Paenactinomyces guangxiensis TaxID=1490290 RepID=A0A7W2AA00_9BACL|nr:GNAT family N-acetyltransferase [Paenactinomyces guangxiensis]MBA4496265.1 GNAT family N-acetyltransferase [Paenactinomyces guangxiensis]MBH8593318.1 GNAT family N-acetyltransferase [Paenactinomyces guangxiensis]